MTNRNEDLAQENFCWLKSNSYPGRGIVAGLDETGGYLVQVYWIMGRSPNSRNRVFKCDDDGRLYTEAADVANMTDPSLVIYNAMRERDHHYIVSNGDQTDTVADATSPMLLNKLLTERQYEPDKPNFTQRITAVSSLVNESSHRLQMSILRKSSFGDDCDRMLFEYIPHAGFGYCITTYAGDGDPLPSFRDDPLIMPIRGDRETVAESYWDALNPEHRVSLAVKFIKRSSGHSKIYAINKYEQS